MIELTWLPGIHPTMRHLPRAACGLLAAASLGLCSDVHDLKTVSASIPNLYLSPDEFEGFVQKLCERA